jgi:hypothetical protein
MESPASTALRPIIVRDRQSSPWTRTVAVIRVPRFNAFGLARRAGELPDDPLNAFIAEVELEAPRQRRRR